MAKCSVVNLRKEPFDVYIGRAGKGCDGYFGNPFRLGAGESRGATLANYRSHFHERLTNDEEFRKRVRGLRGKVLGCFCKPASCHGDIIAEYVNGLGD